jgi:hypothetical protein
MALPKETAMQSGTWKLVLAEDDENEYVRIQAWFAGRLQAEV